jgi:peptidoglycan/LPS O-acetylase OafA/YrhL
MQPTWYRHSSAAAGGAQQAGFDNTRGRRAFDDVRLLAATGVILSHSFHLTGSTDPVTSYIGFGNLGTLCVIAFMALSGYLVTQSWESDPRVTAFFAKRALRILPALVVVVAVTTLVVGPLVTTKSLGAYIGNSDTWRYLVDNAVIHPDPTVLPGVFATNPETVTNASLWTLPYEVTFYLTVPLLLIAASRVHKRLTLVIAYAVLAGLALDGLRDTNAVWTMRTGWLTLFGIAFLTGAMLRSFPPRLVAPAAALALCVAAASRGTSIWPLTCTTAVATIAVAVGSVRIGVPDRRRFAPDLSYGLYLWGYPVQQLVVSLTAVRRPLVLFVIALPLTAVCAAASWKFVEAPALRLKTRLRRKGFAAPTLAETIPPQPHQKAAAMIT